jgi:hypothetical protein
MHRIMLALAFACCIVACQSAPTSSGPGAPAAGAAPGPNGCMIPAAQGCQGCSVNCPADKRPLCKPALSEPGLEPFQPQCVEPAQCRCV